jgi:hypothetical protein
MTQNHCYAIVGYSKGKEFNKKKYEALWMENSELNSFAGTVGFRIAQFYTVAEAQDSCSRQIRRGRKPQYLVGDAGSVIFIIVTNEQILGNNIKFTPSRYITGIKASKVIEHN